MIPGEHTGEDTTVKSLGIVVLTLNMEDSLPDTLQTVLIDQDFFDLHVIVMDGGSTDRTVEIAQGMGLEVFQCEASRGVQVSEGIEQVRGDWILTITGDTALSLKWPEETYRFVTSYGASSKGGFYPMMFRQKSLVAKLIAWFINKYADLLGMPIGEQGFVVSRLLLVKLGGFRRIPVYEDVDIAKRVGKKNLKVINAVARVDKSMYGRSGMVWGSLKRFYGLILFLLKFPPDYIARQVS